MNKKTERLDFTPRRAVVKFYYNNQPSEGEHVSSMTKTVPDLSYSLQEIIDRFTRNNLADMEYHEPVYSHNDTDFDQDDLEKIRDMDLTDKWQKYLELDALRLEAIDISRKNAIERSKDSAIESTIVAPPTLETPEKID